MEQLRKTLRPCFFRYGDDRPFSGFLSRSTQGNIDLWAYEDVAAQVVEISRQTRPVVARTLQGMQVNAMGLVAMHRATLALMPGERLIFSQDVDLFPHTYIKRHEVATVVDRDQTTGEATLYLQGRHKGLFEVNNTWTLTPHQVSDAELSSIMMLVDDFTARIHQPAPSADMAEPARPVRVA